MDDNNRSVCFGFTEQKFPPGAHVCQIYTTEEERHDSLFRFLQAGLAAGERATCFSEKVNAPALQQLLEAEGIPFDAAVKSGAFSLSGTGDAYFHEGCFNPDKILALLKEYHNESRRLGYQNARVIGEMTSAVQHMPGGERLLEYESRVSLLLQTHPITAVCQYSAHDFNGAVIMDVLKVHPFMVVRGSVVHNPFYIPPEHFLAQ